MADEYIRREDALRAVQRQRGANRSPAQNEMLNRIKTDIIRAPAADVAPVAPGKWGDNGITGSMLVKCSVCGFDCGANSFSYCPKCGARMRQAKRGKTQRKYREILALYLYCVEVRMDARLERLHDGWAIRFPNGGDFAQHAGTYGANDGFVEPAIGCEADYSPVSLREAEKLICENRERLVTPSCEGERGMEGE